MAGNVEKDSDGDEERHERRSSVTDERKGDAGKRDDVEIDSDVDERLNQYPRRNPGCHVFGKRIVHPAGDAEAPVRDVAVASDEHDDSEESEFLGDDGKDEVPLHFGEVSELLDRFAEPESEKPPASYGDKTLLGLEVDGLVGNRRLVVSEEVVDTFGNVGERVPFAVRRLPQSVDGKSEEAEYEKGDQDVFGIASADEEHDDGDRGDEENGSEVRLHGEQEHDGSEKRHVRQVTAFERVYFRPSPFEEVREIQDRAKLDEFDGLKGKRKERNVDPSSRPVIDDPDEQDYDEGEEASEKDVLGILFKDRVRRLYDESEEEYSDKHVRNVAHEVEVVVGFGKLSRGGHERRDLERRIDADRTDHDHSENDEREDDEKNAVVDTFGFEGRHARNRGLRTERESG